MAKRKRAHARSPLTPVDPALVLMGDVRPAPIEIREGGRTYNPDVALWVRAEDGFVVGTLIGEAGQRAQTLVQALLQTLLTPGAADRPMLPGQVVLFDEQLANEVLPILEPLNVEVHIAPRFEPFEQMYTELFAHLEQTDAATATLDLPTDVLKPLVAAAERLWRARPWEYSYDEPPFALVPRQAGARPFYASIMGANRELLGVALYTSLADYENTLLQGESILLTSPTEDDAATSILQMIRDRMFLVTFEPKDEVKPAYREQLAGCGWTRRLSVVPSFAGMSGGQEAGVMTADEAPSVTLAVDALVAFCQRHRNEIADEDFPIRDSVEVQTAGGRTMVDVVVPPDEDASASPSTVYRFRVALVGRKDVWRRIDVRSNQTLVDLHYAIQDAFDWDDDHLYAFFLNGKAWDPSAEYVRPEGQQPGERSARVRLDRLNLHPSQRILYIFDFGDEWRHEVRVEKVDLKPDEGEYPRIVEEHGKPPPQYPNWDEEDEDSDG